MRGSSDDKEVEVPWLFGLKLFVIVAGIVLVAGSVVLVWLLAGRIEDREAGAPATAAVPSAEALASSGGGLQAFIPPAGARIIEAALDGASILLLLEDPGGKQYLAILETASGRQRFMIELGAAAP